MLLTVLALASGLFLLYIGAEGLVRGGAGLASRLGLTRLVVGLTVVAYGTSSPELVVSVNAALDGNSAIALGNIVGSNICNVALILGLSALVRPLRVHAQVIRLQIPIMIAASIVLPLLLLDGRLSRLEGLGLFCGVCAYTACSVFVARKESTDSSAGECRTGGTVIPRQLWMEILFAMSGLAMLAAGARLFVSGAVSLADSLGISQAIIGLTIVAVGTSLPELATSLVAAIRKEGDIAVGNVVGSNIFNILAILGLASLSRPIETGGIHAADFIVMILTGVFALPLMRTGFLLTRGEGLLLLAVYAGYICYLLP